MSESTGRSRREFLAFGAGAFVVAAIPLARRRRSHVVRRTLPVMGTIAELAVVHRDERTAHAAIDAAMAELRRVETLMTRFTSTSDIGRANVGAARDAVAVSGETALVVREALRWADATAGALDPAIGGAVALWDVTHRHEPPPEPRVARLARRNLHRAVEVGTRNGAHVLRFHDADVRLDLGAIAKGYGVDRAVDALRTLGISHALVDVGGDLYALGSAPGGDPWRIGIQDPDDTRGIIGEVDVADAAVATSGTYVQFFRWRGRSYHHLLDPATASPRATAVRSLTIQADSCMHADVAATALFGMPEREASRVIGARVPGGRVVRIA
ncbi:MAG TPA: FAD:protein FMN transferase [Gemmatimonadaceae bacterium]|nr:FAD:protein FMN transferase [Gemmatimonadaceae bacterium]